MTRRLEVWWAGTPTRGEWAEPHDGLNAQADVRHFASVREVSETLGAGTSPPELLVVAQSRPGEIAPRDIEAIRRLAPLLPVVQWAGSWCEGELRSGRPWRAAQRLYWHQAATQQRADLARHAQGETPDWMLPLTTIEDERLLARLASMPRTSNPPQAQGRQVVIAASSYAMRQWLAEGARAFGFQPLDQADLAHRAPDTSIVAGIWDGNSLAAKADLSARETLAAFTRQLGPVPVAALLSFPRLEDVEIARQAGARLVVSKPCLIVELLSSLEAIL